jgi:hypothetical protein
MITVGNINIDGDILISLQFPFLSIIPFFPFIFSANCLQLCPRTSSIVYQYVSSTVNPLPRFLTVPYRNRRGKAVAMQSALKGLQGLWLCETNETWNF